VYLIRATIAASAKFLEMDLAMVSGVVTNACPLIYLPSLSLIIKMLHL